ncbi:MAG TPA: hypothetical protein PLV98_00995 [Dysgonamonadaceae bacterium]|jgi:hypothetical protein|nr:hypothetical protein [Dysgonamonadaceae bacterium]HQG08045.1 hypothetical protein [Dysgonamonadaceae bacterium]
MKVVLRAILIAAILLLGFLCWRSIQAPIEFQREVAKREKAVIQRLIDIRTSQVAFRDVNGRYTASFDSLVDFVKNGKVVTLSRYGDLTEEQLESGMTEEKAMQIIRTGNEKAIRAAGLWDEENNRPQLRRDSIYAPAFEVLFPNRPKALADSLPYVPYGNGAKFEMGTAVLETASGYPVQVFEAKTPYTTFLGDLDKKLLGQKIQEVLDRPGDRNYPGLKVGSLTVANNNAGNWE